MKKHCRRCPEARLAALSAATCGRILCSRPDHRSLGMSRPPNGLLEKCEQYFRKHRFSFFSNGCLCIWQEFPPVHKRRKRHERARGGQQFQKVASRHHAESDGRIVAGTGHKYDWLQSRYSTLSKCLDKVLNTDFATAAVS